MQSSSDGDAAAAAGVLGLGVVGLVLVVVVVIFLVLLHFLPGIIASSRKHPQALAIWLVNIFLGWSGIGWLAALIWAFITPQPTQLVGVPMAMPPQPYPPQPAPTPQLAMPPAAAPSPAAARGGVSAMADEIAALARLRDQGVLTEAEFTARKHLLLDGRPPAPPEAV